MEKKLFNKDFTLVVIGQIISLFGNAIIRLALPLYLLDLTGSATLYGTALACSMIPIILLSPIGGIIADRINKRNIMVGLDFGTAFLLVLFTITVRVLNPVVIIIITMMILFGIQALYQPAVQGSMPLLSSPQNLLASNSIINQVSALSSLIGPIIGGVIYGMAGIEPVIIMGIICFVFSAIMEIFIRIPYTKQQVQGGLVQIAISDFKEGMQFVLKERTVIIKVAFICAGINLILSSMMMVGLPVIIKMKLGLSNQLYGYAEAAIGAGSLLGGICVGLLRKKLKIQKSDKLLLGTSLTMVPVGIALVLEMSPLVVYSIIVAASTICMICSTIFSIQALTYVQEETPINLIGKVIACVMAICMCAQPIGQAIYGVLFEMMKDEPQWIILVGVLLSTLLSIVSRKTFRQIKHQVKGTNQVAQSSSI